MGTVQCLQRLRHRTRVAAVGAGDDGLFVLEARPEQRQLLLDFCFAGRWHRRIVDETRAGTCALRR